MAAARGVPVPCEICGREITRNNMARHLATHGNGAAPKPTRKRRPAKTGRAATVAVGAYLDELAEPGYAPGRVALGALENFPANTRDPEIVDAAAAEIERRADETTSRVVEIK